MSTSYNPLHPSNPSNPCPIHNNTIMKKTTLIYIITFFATTAFAQPLDSLLKIAVENNYELKALQNEYLAALEKAPQVSQLPNPEASLGLFVLPAETRLGPQRFVGGISQMFPWKGTLQVKEDLALSNARAKYESIAATKLNLFYQIKTAYFQVYELEKSKRVFEDNIQIFKALERLTLAKTESGRGSLADVLRVQLKLQDLAQQLKIIDNQKRSPLATLNQILGRAADVDVGINIELTQADMLFDKSTLAQSIRKNHPIVRLFSIQQERAQKAIELNALKGKPSFGIGLDYILVGKRSDAEPERNGQDILIPKVKVSIPLYRKKYTAKKQEEQLKIAALENRKKEVQSKFLASIEKAYADYEDAVLKLDLYQKQIKTTKVAIEILKEQYSNSGSSFDELLRLENSLVNYDLKILKAIVKSHIAKATIERYVL